jgi:hypothetical protein
MTFLALSSVVSVFIPALATIGRYKRSPAIYRPFFWFIWVGAFTEGYSLVAVYLLRSKNISPNSNIYVLIEFGILLWLFYEWNGGKKSKKYFLFFAIGMVIWVWDNIFLHTLQTINSQFRVYYCVILLYLSVNQINKLFIFEKKSLLKNAMFLTCITFVCFYSYKAFVESFYILERPFSPTFYRSLFYIMQFVNLISNLVFTIVLLCIPKRREFFIPS